ncbi:MAG TPA: redoxin domain-containing protein [Bryobacteraceae bacterium]|jgi:cytochrome c biogenesis protein CcmG/thiol:disulfide interchange protein DsbE
MQVPAKSLLLVSVAVAALLWSCSGKDPFNAEAQSIKNRKPAADFTLRDANGAAVKLSDYRGKVVLLNFWATWCGPCTLEIPWFIEFEQQYKTQGFAVVGVSMDEDGWNAIKPYVAAHKMNYRVLLGDDSVSQLYGGVESLPTTFLIDRKGRVAFPPHIGLAGKNEYLKEIQSLLGEQQHTTSLVSAPLPLAALRFGPAK